MQTTERVLRTINVYGFFLALALLPPFGVIAKSTLLPMNLLPAAASAVLGLIALGGGMRLRAVAIPLDAVMVGAYLGMIIPSIQVLCNQRFPNYAILGAYGTVPLLVNACIHIFLIIRHLPLPGFDNTTTCPNCNHEHQIHKSMRFPGNMFPASTIFTPDDDEQSEPLARDFDENTLVRASSEVDEGFVDMRQNQKDEPTDRLV